LRASFAGFKNLSLIEQAPALGGLCRTTFFIPSENSRSPKAAGGGERKIVWDLTLQGRERQAHQGRSGKPRLVGCSRPTAIAEVRVVVLSCGHE